MTSALIRPTPALFDSWAAAVAESITLADTTVAPPEGRVHNDLYWIVDEGEVVGFLSFRHALNDYLREVGGHIGYAVRESRRRQGYASAGLALALDRAREIGLDRVLVTCDDDNEGSARTIEGAGGVLQDVRDQSEKGHPMLRRYWIAL